MIVERFGFPFFINKFYRRKLFFIGFFLCMAMIYLFSTYIWNINLTGNQTYTNENITKFLKEINIEKGIKRSKVDCAEIAREIRKKFDDIIWVSASIEGSNLILQIKENEDEKEIINNTHHNERIPYDVVADRDCVITGMIIRNGIANVNVGDSVKKGDLLVSGQIPVYNDAKEIINYQYCESDADITGKTTLTYENINSVKYKEKEYANIEKDHYYFTVGKYRVSLGDIKNNYKDFEEYSAQKRFGDFTFGMRSVSPYTVQYKKYSKTDIQKILSSDFQYYCEELEKKGVVILENDVKIYTWSDKAKASGKLTVEMPVGQKIKSELKEIGDNIDGNDGNNN